MTFTVSPSAFSDFSEQLNWEVSIGIVFLNPLNEEDVPQADAIVFLIIFFLNYLVLKTDRV